MLKITDAFMGESATFDQARATLWNVRFAVKSLCGRRFSLRWAVDLYVVTGVVNPCHFRRGSSVVRRRWQDFMDLVTELESSQSPVSVSRRPETGDGRSVGSLQSIRGSVKFGPILQLEKRSLRETRSPKCRNRPSLP